jgi:hypothetical protein
MHAVSIMEFKSFVLTFLYAAGTVLARSAYGPTIYQAGAGVSSTVLGGHPTTGLQSFSYSETGFGAAESTIYIDNGTFIYSPAFSEQGVGYATSNDNGNTWSQVLPAGANQLRVQPAFKILDGRYFYWSTSSPGVHMSYSDDRGQTWTSLGKNAFPEMLDWAKMIGGKPVSSSLKSGVNEIIYFSAPNPISTGGSGLEPTKQLFWKSLDKGTTWTLTKGAPSIKSKEVDGACAELSDADRAKEIIIWGDGVVRANGTLIYGFRRCRKLSMAISDDEGDTWRFKDIPGSDLSPYTDLSR